MWLGHWFNTPNTRVRTPADDQRHREIAVWFSSLFMYFQYLDSFWWISSNWKKTSSNFSIRSLKTTISVETLRDTASYSHCSLSVLTFLLQVVNISFNRTIIIAHLSVSITVVTEHWHFGAALYRLIFLPLPDFPLHLHWCFVSTGDVLFATKNRRNSSADTLIEQKAEYGWNAC